jgi:Leucine-rich repeat (LRR) protein
LILDKKCDLTHLDIEGNQMGDKNLFVVASALQEAKQITSLNVSKNKLTDKAAKQLGNLLTACVNKLNVLLVHFN